MKGIILGLILLFIVFAIIFYKGKGGFLMAGYNTAPKEVKAKYDIKKLNRLYFYLSCGIIVLLTLYYFIGDAFEIPLIIGALILVILLLIVEKKKKKKGDEAL